MHPALRRLLSVLALALVALPAARASSPHFLVTSATPPDERVFGLLDTQVEVTIAGPIAEVAVVQTYANHGPAPLDAVYVFPGSTGAAVHGLTMVVGGRVVRARIRPREEARRTHEAARAAGRTSSLLEQERPNLFQMDLANIPPGGTVHVELRYTEWVPQREGVAEFVLPTFVAPRYRRGAGPDEPGSSGGGDGATFGFRLALFSPTPVRALACPTHPVRIEAESEGVARLRLDPDADPTDHSDRDLVVRYQLSGDAPAAGLLLARAPGADEGWFLATLQPPARVEPARIPPRDYVFVVDVSGSMHGFPLETTRGLLRGLIGGLRPEDTFNLLLFAGGSARLAPRPLAANPENLARAIVLLELQQAGGGTELLPALAAALATPQAERTSRTFVVVTDGLVDIEAEAFDLVQRRPAGTTLFAFGIGDSVNRHLIEGLARAGGGEPVVILAEAEAPEAAAGFLRRIESPVLTGVRAHFEGFAASDVEPTALADVFADRPVTLFGRWRGAPTGRIVLSGHGGAGPFTASLDVARAVVLEDSRALELLWARARITALEDRELGGRDPDRVSAITRLGLAHGLLTKHTSFVAVDEGGPDSPAAPPGGPAFPAAGDDVPTTPEPGATGLAAIVAGLLAVSMWRRRWA